MIATGHVRDEGHAIGLDAGRLVKAFQHGQVLLEPGRCYVTGRRATKSLYDYGLACRIVAPEWYGRLRLALTAAASTLLAAAALA